MLVIILITVLTLFSFYHFYWKRRNLPPGPLPLPLMGNVLEIHKVPPGYDTYIRWTKQYGPLYTYWLGEVPIIAFNDYELMKEVFIKDGEKFTERYDLGGFMRLFKGGDVGIISCNGDLWREQRRFVLHTLRDFGMGKNVMEERVMTEVDALLDRLSTNGKEIEIQRELDVAVGSIINNILFGYRFEQDNVDEFFRLKDWITSLFKTVTNVRVFLAWIFPFLRRIVPSVDEAWKNVFNVRDSLSEFFRRQIKMKRHAIDFSNEEYSDFVECYLKEQHKRRDQEDFGGYFDLQLENVIQDLWVAGLETTSNTICWGICYILNYPDVQKKVHEEMDSVIQSDRRISLADKNNLPYLNAFICEVQRTANIFPKNLSRRAKEDVLIRGYTIPKGTCLSPQISVVLYDEKVFPEPLKFSPERFLNVDGSLRKIEELIPFSIGKRQCPGEGLAKVQLFLFLANILQRYEITSESTPSMKKTAGMSMQPIRFKCKFLERIQQNEKSPKKPSPLPFPLVGNVLQLHKFPPGYQAYINWTKLYGPLYTYWMGEDAVVAFNDYELIKEVFIKDGERYTERFDFGNFTQFFKGGEVGIISSNGDLWREQRRFVLHTLRDFGMGKNVMEERVMAEVDTLFERLSWDDEADIQREIDVAVGSVVNNILFGYRFEKDNLEEFFVLRDLITAQFKAVANIRWFFAWKLPFLRGVPWINAAWREVFEVRDALSEFFKGQIRIKRAEVDFESESSNDFVECYLKEQHRRRDEENFGGYFELQLENVIQDLWVAGLETTSNTICWGLCYILNYSEVQRKLHAELDTVIQSERKITLTDRNSLPYMNAFICEVQRMANILPQNLFRKTQEDVVIRGYTIPKGTCVIPQISVVLYDEKVFPDPFKFNPDRFLNADGSLRKVEELIPFSIGKRQCPGEGLAKLELFLFLANIMQRYEINSNTLPSMEKVAGLTMQPIRFKCQFRERK